MNILLLVCAGFGAGIDARKLRMVAMERETKEQELAELRAEIEKPRRKNQEADEIEESQSQDEEREGLFQNEIINFR